MISGRVAITGQPRTALRSRAALKTESSSDACRPLFAQLSYSVAHEQGGQDLLFHSVCSMRRHLAFLFTLRSSFLSFVLFVRIEFGPDINVGILTHFELFSKTFGDEDYPYMGGPSKGD